MTHFMEHLLEKQFVYLERKSSEHLKRSAVNLRSTERALGVQGGALIGALGTWSARSSWKSGGGHLSTRCTWSAELSAYLLLLLLERIVHLERSAVGALGVHRALGGPEELVGILGVTEYSELFCARSSC